MEASSGLAFRQRYVQRFLPLLSCIREKRATKRFKAVKKAADISLACTAGKTSWSKALCRRLSISNRCAQKQRIRERSSSSNNGFTVVDEAGFASLMKRTRRRVRAARAKPVNYRRCFLRAQREQNGCKRQQQQLHVAPVGGKLQDTSQVVRVASTCLSSTQCGNLQASKLLSLSELIPGGLRMDIPKLLDQTAHYIISLQLQVEALSFLGQTLSA